MIKLNKTNIIIISVVVFVIILVVILVIASKKKKKSDNPESEKDIVETVTRITKVTPTYLPESFPLKKYMMSPGETSGIKTLQSELNRRGANLTVDGWLGDATTEAMIKILNMSSVTKEQLDNLVKESINSVASANKVMLPDTSTVNGVQQYANILFQDLTKESYFLGRDQYSGGGIYPDLLSKDNTTFTSIYNTYKNIYASDLAAHVKLAFFKIGSDLDNRIIEKANLLGLTTVK